MVLGQQGTSFATAYVSGVVALVRAYRPGLTVAQIKHRIEVTADHPAAPLPDSALGYGEVNPYDAVTALLPEELGPTSQSAGSIVPAPLVAPRHVGRSPRGQALAATAGIGIAALIVLVLAAVVPAGQRRHWSPGQRKV